MRVRDRRARASRSATPLPRLRDDGYFFTYGNWWIPLPPGYGNVTLENNVFEHTEQGRNGGWHYYSLYVANIGPNGAADPMPAGWSATTPSRSTPPWRRDRGSNGTRWVGNLGGWDCVPGIALPPQRR